MTPYTQVDSNKRKTFFYIFLFIIFIIFLGWIFSLIYDSPVILYLAIIISLIQSLISYYVGDKIVLSMTHAFVAPKDKYAELHRIVENLAITVGLPKPQLYIIPDEALNAFATGRDPKHSSIAVTQGLIDNLEKKEIEGVIAHELSHIGNRDSLLMVVIVILVGLVAILSDLFVRMNFFSLDNDRNRNSSGFILVLGLILAILAPIAAGLIQLAISRKREFMADANGVLLTRYPQGLANALRKISRDSHRLRYSNDVNSLLYISNPIKKKSWISSLFSTHPPIEERIKLLEEM